MNIRHAVIAAVLSATVSTPRLVRAQASETKIGADSASHWSLLVPSGTMVPTGSMRHAIKRASVTAVQVAYAPLPMFSISSTVGWARSRDIATAGDPKLNVFTYDVGAEARMPHLLRVKGIAVTPFTGVGAGGRSYNYRSLNVDATHNLASYLSVGSEVRVRRVGLRLEARNYVSQFKTLDGTGKNRTSNDVMLMAGFRILSR